MIQAGVGYLISEHAMMKRTARVSVLYCDRGPLRWARALNAVDVQSLAALCMRQWRKVPAVSLAIARHMPMDGR
jgi:hypothetical protein